MRRSKYVMLYVKQSKRFFRVEQDHAQIAALSYVRAYYGNKEQTTAKRRKKWKK
jgi:hypothetical protein